MNDETTVRELAAFFRAQGLSLHFAGVRGEGWSVQIRDHGQRPVRGTGATLIEAINAALPERVSATRSENPPRSRRGSRTRSARSRSGSSA